MRTILAYILAILVVGGLFAFGGLYTLDRLVSDARTEARTERDAHWAAEIANANAETERQLKLQAMKAAAADSAARDRLDAVNLKLQELEKANEALSDDGSGGLSRDRVKLLYRRPE